jgi:hypothetical protein
MNTGQTMLTIMALTLLSVITLSYYRSMGQTGVTLSNSNTGFTATTVATSFLERIEGYRFDEYPLTSSAPPLPDSTRFTMPADLGCTTTAETDSGEVLGDYTTYDDIDDFNGNVLTYNTDWNNEVYQIKIRVYYVNPWTDAYTEVAVRTFLKRIDVNVIRTYPPIDTTEKREVNLTALHGFYLYNPI